MLTPTAERNILRIIPIGLIWLVFSLVYSLLERGLLGELDHYPATGNPYNFSKTIFITTFTSLLIGLLVGTIEIRYFYRLFNQKSFIQKMGYKTLIYLAIIISSLFLITLINNVIELKTAVLDKRVRTNVWAFFSNYAFWGVAVYIAAIIGVSLFYSEVSDNLGQGVLTNFFTGKYHNPIEEDRIFMFLDMKSSTTIAENLGHVIYFEMLREYYSDLSNPILQYAGEIYHYVGDEIVVSWKLQPGLQNGNCVQCFFAMKMALQKQKSKYQEKFGLLPEFKAGLHLGDVTTGEIGVLKKEIIFTGDVLNTTARIQALCNLYQADLLLSGHVRDKLLLQPPFRFQALGERELRGRDEKVQLFTIRWE